MKASAKYEETTLTKITQARAEATGIKLTGDDFTDPDKMKKFQEAQDKLLKTYQGLGGSGSFLGFPTRDQYTISGAWAADFEGGTIRTVNGVTKVYRK